MISKLSCCKGLVFAEVPLVGLLRWDEFIVLIGVSVAVLVLFAVVARTSKGCRDCCGRRFAAVAVVAIAFLFAYAGFLTDLVQTWLTSVTRAGFFDEADDDFWRAYNTLQHTPKEWLAPHKVPLLTAEEAADVKRAVLSRADRFVHIDHLAVGIFAVFSRLGIFPELTLHDDSTTRQKGTPTLLHFESMCV